MSYKKYDDFLDKNITGFSNLSAVLKTDAKKVKKSFRGSYDSTFDKALIQLNKFDSLEIDASATYIFEDKNTFTYLAQLKNLQYLDISENHLNKIPDLVTEMHSLIGLAMYRIRLTMLPKNFTNLKLKHLNIGANKIKNIEIVNNIETLENLQVSRSLVNEKFISTLPQLTNLKKLNLRETGIEYVPKDIDKLTQLKELDISENNLTNIPDTIANLKNLENIAIRKNKELNWNSTFTILSKLPKLKTLNLHKQSLQVIAENIALMTQITHLNFSQNNITELPEGIKKLSNLESVNFSDNPNLNYQQLFEILKYLPKLKKIHLLNYPHESIPEEIADLHQIETIVIENANIKNLPKSINHLKSLKNISLIDCKKLKQIPESFAKLDTLACLTLSLLPALDIDNTFETISLLKNLASLNIDLKTVQVFPKSFAKINTIKKLVLNNHKTLQLRDTLIQIAKIPQLESFTCIQERLNIPDEIKNFGHLKEISFNFSKAESSNKFLNLPIEIALFKDIIFKSNNPKIFEKLNEYYISFGKSKLTDKKKKIIFGILTNNNKVLSEIIENPLAKPDFIPQKAIFYTSGRINGFSQKDLKEKLKEYQIKTASKLHQKVTHVIIGSNNKNTTLETIINNDNIHIILEDHAKEYFWKQDSPFLMEEGTEDMNENILNLLFSGDKENLEMAFQMLEGGGAHPSIVTFLTVMHLFHIDTEVRKKARTLFKIYASNNLQTHIKENWKVGLRNKQTDFKILKTLYTHPELNVGDFMVMCNKLEWDKNNAFTVNRLYWRRLSFEKLPESIKYLSDLEHISLSDNKKLDYEQACEVLKNLPKLYIIDLTDANLTKIPDTLFEISSLKKLLLAGNDITQIPNEIENLKNLEELFIGQNPIKKLNKNLEKLNKLKVISAANCGLDDIDTLYNIPSLKTISLSSNKIKEIKDNITNLVNLKVFEAQNNFIESIPEALTNLESLEELKLDNNKIKDIHGEIKWKDIKYISLDQNQIKSIPESIKNCKGLLTLCLKENLLEEVQPSLIENKQITTIFLSKNKIKTFPSCLSELDKLYKLRLDNNLIQKIPNKMKGFTGIQSLILFNNQIESLPEELPSSFSECKIDLYNNPISTKEKKAYKKKFKNISFSKQYYYY